MVQVPVQVQPFASVMVTVNVPEARLLMVCVVELLLHLYLYTGVPPAGLAVALPFPAPWQVMLVEVTVAVNRTGWVMVTDAVAVQLCASVAVMV